PSALTAFPYATLFRSLDLGGVRPGRVGQVFGTVELPDLSAGRADGVSAQGRGVGTHVGDEAVLVETLGDRHRGRRAHPELAAGLDRKSTRLNSSHVKI